jgi:hypothetical protein
MGRWQIASFCSGGESITDRILDNPKLYAPVPKLVRIGEAVSVASRVLWEPYSRIFFDLNVCSSINWPLAGERQTEGNGTSAARWL